MKNEWIDVRDRLPEKDGLYIVNSGATKGVFTAYYWADVMRWRIRGITGKEVDLHYITHWMPLPDPPKEEKK